MNIAHWTQFDLTPNKSTVAIQSLMKVGLSGKISMPSKRVFSHAYLMKMTLTCSVNYCHQGLTAYTVSTNIALSPKRILSS